MVCSRDLSEKLWKAGVMVETEKWHILIGDNNGEPVWVVDYLKPYDKGREKFPAPSTDELLVLLPDLFVVQLSIVRNGEKPFQVLSKPLTVWGINYAEALGKMILWLLSNGYHFKKGRVFNDQTR